MDLVPGFEDAGPGAPYGQQARISTPYTAQPGQVDVRHDGRWVGGSGKAGFAHPGTWLAPGGAGWSRRAGPGAMGPGPRMMMLVKDTRKHPACFAFGRPAHRRPEWRGPGRLTRRSRHCPRVTRDCRVAVAADEDEGGTRLANPGPRGPSAAETRAVVEERRVLAATRTGPGAARAAAARRLGPGPGRRNLWSAVVMRGNLEKTMTNEAANVLPHFLYRAIHPRHPAPGAVTSSPMTGAVLDISLSPRGGGHGRTYRRMGAVRRHAGAESWAYRHGTPRLTGGPAGSFAARAEGRAADPPTGGPDAAFPSASCARGAGPHHYKVLSSGHRSHPGQGAGAIGIDPGRASTSIKPAPPPTAGSVPEFPQVTRPRALSIPGGPSRPGSPGPTTRPAGLGPRPGAPNLRSA